MDAQIISGKEISEQIREELREKVAYLKDRGITPGLGVVLVGEDPASKIYVNNKIKACEDLGLKSKAVILPAEVTEDELLKKVDELNADPEIHAFLVQLPLPKHIDENKVINRIDPHKDADAFHPFNVGRMLIGDPIFMPATPHGIQEMLVRSGNDPAGKHVVIIGRSNIVGKPVAAILMQKGKGANATVTVCHSRTSNLQEIVKTGDIVVAAIGSPRFITKDMIKEGAVVIDVGTNRVEDATAKKGYRLVGDVDFENVKEVASAITPVPGGVGPMTIVMLMKNAISAAYKANNLEM
ncbi:bifunctional 5,10-methylene-tetrahydrofolate dehydrogenase/5,10-methylene-tetrahydrofolate cyclohydrolase [Candidatus Methanomassiliicoccus intestinalis]|jgi:bifunctional protein folD|uniref:Bifunctional protein FolD n=3 Tax=Candidatus Methanomassiliicoccus intestinalis TaxID=1406512 RepID=R9TBV0_METII|nr:bifunctional 5,10-methylene-tetrahydrofolate dehydrogenase/5,10-methylene-tetrahydrofolate cyclohydrolase [Candidatus Methanomassiliicoccus intestinalis]AGN26938.1 bifunctional 5,10-methylene-tetrahydrofolate dehydrogenase/ 5,10-methylene-tetrahydrofolate cyclohydrolase [Candidatus Methanomassiliicoccus intestinalis Issoire-Mx1]TQS81328.1 MAG: bifunctional 5,10-methylene-tetrahydrofolate dehydrogenase/5,10-methylene-tetrahydrofolate cyclohydrolase [Candidatus Methanomassiliicoccus intestinalis